MKKLIVSLLFTLAALAAGCASTRYVAEGDCGVSVYVERDTPPDEAEERELFELADWVCEELDGAARRLAAAMSCPDDDAMFVVECAKSPDSEKSPGALKRCRAARLACGVN